MKSDKKIPHGSSEGESMRPVMLQGTSSSTKIERSPWSRVYNRLKDISYLPKDFKEWSNP